MEIEFDDNKAISNLKKHGVSFAEAEIALFDPQAMSIEDPDSELENRWVLVGIGSRLRLLTVIYTVRGERIRIISARQASKREVMNYAQGI
jgi:uncharacterized DUF497 family protein